MAGPLLVGLLLLLTGCDGEPARRGGAGPPSAAAVAAAVQELADDLRQADVAAVPGPLRAAAGNVRRLRLVDVDLRQRGEPRPLPDGGLRVPVSLSWRLAGADAGPARLPLDLVLGEGGVRTWRPVSEAVPAWLTTGLVRVDRGEVSVLAPGREQARALALPAVRARRQVTEVLGETRPLVVELVPDAWSLAAALGRSAAPYAGIAAVTARVADTPGAPVHVFVKRSSFARMTALGQRVVLTHEATHAAVDAGSSEAPLWLVEGLADYVALRPVRRPVAVLASRAARADRQGRLDIPPSRGALLESSAGRDAAYEASWLVCRAVAHRAGPDGLLRWYARADVGEPVWGSLRRTTGLRRARMLSEVRAALRSLSAGRRPG